MNDSFNIFKEYETLNPCIQHKILSKLQVLQFAKHDHILKKGEICKGIFLIEKGCCRTYLENGGKEITTNFRIEQNIISSAYSYLTQMPSEECIQTLEDTTCYFFSHKNIHLLLDEYVEFNIFVRKIYETLLMNEINLLNSIRSMSALERYEQFMEKTPQILQRVPLGHLASFLGMSQETLSRMRGKV
ncbi:Crp/Fnr family transcriptional regulator [Arcicella sp. LKC2W]|uniref:Crp/Fnr family transcriptional regulator n=1 Tax=Arcicella sp. LKC2W TaxID=2984198 RepID=UPI002B1FDA20|nr:Crp/Fnr family transcriptional regulator [Arcicella sp. LKC2W]MEA5461494.1 Crp/Fnr family transcriptional regulator [Arcicella sp. LKC2W]